MNHSTAFFFIAVSPLSLALPAQDAPQSASSTKILRNPKLSRFPLRSDKAILRCLPH